MYFRKFPDIYYQYDINGKPTLKIVSDITTNVRFRKEILDNVTLYDSYDVQDGETPEIVAAKLYGSTEYHWVVMLANDVHDYLEDWPLDSRTLDLYIQDKYEDPYAIHHWVSKETGIIVDPQFFTFEEVAAVTNYEHEVIVNDSKRRIKLISPDLLSNILTQFKAIV